MICVQHGSFIDSTSDGVQARSLQRELFDDCEQIFQFRLKEPVSADTMARIIEYARAEIGARYSVAEAVRSTVALRKPRSRRQFCSRLVARVFKMGGIDLVPDADYCSPEDLRRSPLLTEIEVKTERVSDDELEWMNSRRNSIQETHKAQNTILDVARTHDASVENFDDLFSLLVRCPKADPEIAQALQKSGYLNIWRTEVETHPWRYHSPLMEEITSKEDVSALLAYCIGTVKEAYTSGFRYAINLTQLIALNDRYPRSSFSLEIELYQKLTLHEEIRREVAYGWLLKNSPEDLKRNMEQIEPHSAYWYSIIDRVEPRLAALSRIVVDAEGSVDVCSSCGDQPARPYRLANSAETMPGVPSLRLCDECVEIRRDMNNVLVPFL